MLKRFYSGVRRSIQIDSINSQLVKVSMDNGAVCNLSYFFLRDSCKSKECVDPQTGQKLFTTGSIADLRLELFPEIVEDDNGPSMVLKWVNGGKTHRSVYSYDFLQRYSNMRGAVDADIDNSKTYWNLSLLGNIDVDYQLYMNDDRAFYRALQNLNRYGLALVKNCPEETQKDNWIVSKIARRIGYIKHTFYGELFDVQSKLDAENIAYTNLFLPLHMDLLYYESPPGLQLLHLISNSNIKGGENIFADSFHALALISETDPTAYHALQKIPLTYHFHNEEHHYRCQRPLIVEDESYTQLNGKQIIKECNYSPPFQLPFDSSDVIEYDHNNFILHDFKRGLSKFENIINDPVNQFQLKLDDNSCIIFDNRRVLHSRNSFELQENSHRWLKGCYLDKDTFMSKLRVYNEKYKSP